MHRTLRPARVSNLMECRNRWRDPRLVEPVRYVQHHDGCTTAVRSATTA
jgi:hypothetical protein